MARLYTDEDFDLRVAEELRRLGHDIQTVRDAGQGGRGVPDPDVLAFAVAQGRAVLTHNRRHFIKLHALMQPHRGIIACTRDADSAALAARIHQSLMHCPHLDDQLIRVNRPQGP
jgi:predicted nuclease of predicted toxin-antitoxin system